MASMIPMGASLLEGNAQKQGGSSGFGTTQSLWDALDPGNLTGHSSSSLGGNILDPGNVLGLNSQLSANGNPRVNGGLTGNNGIPNVLPNLGAASMIPQMPQGAFQNFNGGPGIFNHMAAQSMGGQMFNPGAMPQLQPNGGGGKGAGGFSPVHQGYMAMMARPSNPDNRRR